MTEKYRPEASPRPFLLRNSAMLIELVGRAEMAVEGPLGWQVQQSGRKLMTKY